VGVPTRVAGGLVVTPEGARNVDVIVEGERIAALDGRGAGEGRVVDAVGCVVLPGGVDPHTHLLADVAAATRSALHGGTTTALSFTAPRPGERPAEALARARDELLPPAAMDVGLHASIWEPEQLGGGDLVELKALGATGVKLFLAYPELGMMASDRRLYETLRDAARIGLPVLVHCENGGAIEALVDEYLAAGRREARCFADTRPPEVEQEAVHRTLALAYLARAPVYLVHLSTAGAVELVRERRAAGQAVSAESCTHHLALDARLYDRPDAARFLTAPPLRPREDIEALWDSVHDRTLSTVGSDHAQARYHPEARSPGDFTGIPYGLPGVETRLPLLLSLGRERGVPLERLVELVSSGPARAFGLYPRKGAVMPGADADLVVWDPDAEWTIEPRTLHDELEDTPYAGMRVHGRVRSVLLRGEPVVEDGELPGTALGRYVSAPGTKEPLPLAGPA
jgi:dihydropyrimidinase